MAAAMEPPEMPETCDAYVMQSAQEAGSDYRSAEAAAVQGDAEAAAGTRPTRLDLAQGATWPGCTPS